MIGCWQADAAETEKDAQVLTGGRGLACRCACLMQQHCGFCTESRVCLFQSFHSTCMAVTVTDVQDFQVGSTLKEQK